MTHQTRLHRFGCCHGSVDAVSHHASGLDWPRASRHSTHTSIGAPLHRCTVALTVALIAELHCCAGLQARGKWEQLAAQMRNEKDQVFREAEVSVSLVRLEKQARTHARTHAHTHSRTHALTHVCTHAMPHCCENQALEQKLAISEAAESPPTVDRVSIDPHRGRTWVHIASSRSCIAV